MFNITKNSSGRIIVRRLSEELGKPRRELANITFATSEEADAYVLGYITGQSDLK